MNCQVWEKEKIKLTQLSSPHPIPAMSLKRMLCSAVLLHYQQTDNLFDSASREYCDVQYTLPHSPFPISINSFLLSNTVCASFFFFFHLSFQQVQDRRKPLSRQVRAHVHCVKDKKKKNRNVRNSRKSKGDTSDRQPNETHHYIECIYRNICYK